MLMIKWHLIFIVLTYEFSNVYSIQCCVDRTCSGKHVDCPLNICFKLGFNVSGNQTEERGCLDEFLAVMGMKNGDRQYSNTDNDDRCQKLTTDGMSLCKCTSDFCNSSTRNSYFLLSVLIILLTFFL